MNTVFLSKLMEQFCYDLFQGDLSDNFTKFVVTVGRLKRLKPQSSTQLKLVKSLISVSMLT